MAGSLQTEPRHIPTAPVVTVYGHCARAVAEIRNAIEAGRAADLVDVPGNFVIVYADGQCDVIVSARTGTVGYYLAAGQNGARPGHGPDVVTAARNAGLALCWNHEAVADYLIFTHPLGTSTFHPKVTRVPAGSVVRASAGGVRVEPVTSPEADADEGRQARPEATVEALLAAVAADVPDGCALSMSGGLDSRLLLAALLALGHRPHLLISGIPGSFDAVVATAIGRGLGLPSLVVTTTEDDVVTGLPEIVLASNGMIPAGNWAGLAHVRSAPSGVPLMFGFNGEIARGYYAPSTGYQALAAVRSAPQAGRPVLFGRRFESPFTVGEQRWLAPELRAALEPAAVAGRLREAVGADHGSSAVAMADRLFAEHYGRQKIGNDLAAIARYVRWRVPLFTPEFARRALALPLSWKLGSRFHRYAIARLYPQLLDYPEEGYGGPRLRSHTPARYWLSGPARPRLPFFLDHEIFMGPRLLGLLTTHEQALSGLAEPELLAALRAEQATAPRRPHAVFALQALALWRAAARLGAPHEPIGADRA